MDVPSQDGDVRIESCQTRQPATIPIVPKPERKNIPMRNYAPSPSPTPPPEMDGPAKKGNTFAALMEEAQFIQNMLRDALLRTNQLLTGLKQYRRQAKAMQSTLASL